MKKYKDLCDYDFSDYAEEITGDALFKINGGAEVENSHESVAGAKPGDTITRKNGDVIVLKQADIDYANAQLGNNGNDGTGNASGNSGIGNNSNSGSNNTSNSRSTNNSSSGANNTEISNTSTSESTPEVSERIKQNSDAYANYMSLQGRAKDEGEPDRYKGYNVLPSSLEGNWIKQTINGIDEYSYRFVVESADYIIPDGFVLDGYVFHKNGTLSGPDGKKINQIKPIQTEKYDIFVSRESLAVDPDTLHNNYFGTSYTGPINPKTFAGEETYDYIPRNQSEFASIVHDKAYSKKGAAGVKGALTNTDVIGADFKLAGSNFRNFLINPDIVDETRSLLTGVCFTLIGSVKSVIWAFKPENQPNYGVPMTVEERYHAHH